MFTSKKITLLVAILATFTIGHGEQVSQTVADAIAQVGSSCNNQQVSSPRVETSSLTEAIPSSEAPKEQACNCDVKREAKEATGEDTTKSQGADITPSVKPEQIILRAHLDPGVVDLLKAREVPLVLTMSPENPSGQETVQSVPKSAPVEEATEEKAAVEEVEEKTASKTEEKSEENATEKKTDEQKVEEQEAKTTPVEKESKKASKKAKVDKKRSKRDAKGKGGKNKGSSKGKQYKQSEKKQKGRSKK